MTEPIPFEVPPGVVAFASKAAKTMNWREANLVRWDNGITLRPIGGWAQLVYDGAPFASRVRKMHKWMTNDGHVVTAFLCDDNVYVEWEGVVLDITPDGGMTPTPGNQAGYGDYLYGLLEYGTPRPGASRLRSYSPTFSLDNWGQELRAMTSADGRLLKWDPTNPTSRMTAVPNAPVGNRSFSVTPERHIMLFGLGGEFDTFGWSDEENDENWEFTNPLSKAGKFTLQPKSPIVAHQSFFGGQTMHTLAKTYMVRWMGLPYIYGYEEIGGASVPVSAMSTAETPNGAVWPTTGGFWQYDGSSLKKLACPVWDWILKHVDFPNTIFEGVSVHVRNFNELWWFFTDKIVPEENSKGVVFDYQSGNWSMVYVGRTCGFVHANETTPIMSDGIKVWKHEVGLNYPGATQLPFLETFNINSSGGAYFTTVQQVALDIDGNPDAIKFSVSKRNNRAGGAEVYSPQRSINADGWADIRETARDMRIRIDVVSNDDWKTSGPMLVKMAQRGQR